MRPLNALLVLGLLAMLMATTGCASNNKGKIEGTKWSSTPGNTVKGQSIPQGFVTLEFGKENSLLYRIGQNQYTGTYSLGMGDTVTLNFEQELAGRKSHAEKIAIQGNTLTMTDSDGTRLTFAKVE